jgi:hypothetical protein
MSNPNHSPPQQAAQELAQLGRREINMYKLNTWMWQFGPCKPCLGVLSVAETGDRPIAVPQDGDAMGPNVAMPQGQKESPKQLPGGVSVLPQAYGNQLC